MRLSFPSLLCRSFSLGSGLMALSWGLQGCGALNEAPAQIRIVDAVRASDYPGSYVLAPAGGPSESFVVAESGMLRTGACYFIHVQGPDLMDPRTLNGDSCPLSARGLGRIFGPFKYGSVGNIEVPVGDNRVIDLVGFLNPHANDPDCTKTFETRVEQVEGTLNFRTVFRYGGTLIQSKDSDFTAPTAKARWLIFKRSQPTRLVPGPQDVNLTNVSWYPLPSQRPMPYSCDRLGAPSGGGGTSAVSQVTIPQPVEIDDKLWIRTSMKDRGFLRVKCNPSAGTSSRIINLKIYDPSNDNTLVYNQERTCGTHGVLFQDIGPTGAAWPSGTLNPKRAVIVQQDYVSGGAGFTENFNEEVFLQFDGLSSSYVDMKGIPSISDTTEGPLDDSFKDLSIPANRVPQFRIAGFFDGAGQATLGVTVQHKLNSTDSFLNNEALFGFGIYKPTSSTIERPFHALQTLFAAGEYSEGDLVVGASYVTSDGSLARMSLKQNTDSVKDEWKEVKVFRPYSSSRQSIVQEYQFMNASPASSSPRYVPMFHLDWRAPSAAFGNHLAYGLRRYAVANFTDAPGNWDGDYITYRNTGTSSVGWTKLRLPDVPSIPVRKLQIETLAAYEHESTPYIAGLARDDNNGSTKQWYLIVWKCTTMAAGICTADARMWIPLRHEMAFQPFDLDFYKAPFNGDIPTIAVLGQKGNGETSILEVNFNQFSSWWNPNSFTSSPTNFVISERVATFNPPLENSGWYKALNARVVPEVLYSSASLEEKSQMLLSGSMLVDGVQRGVVYRSPDLGYNWYRVYVDEFSTTEFQSTRAVDSLAVPFFKGNGSGSTSYPGSVLMIEQRTPGNFDASQFKPRLVRQRGHGF